MYSCKFLLPTRMMKQMLLLKYVRVSEGSSIRDVHTLAKMNLTGASNSLMTHAPFVQIPALELAYLGNVGTQIRALVV